jgi:ubiquinone/menaquinone biosynthesis C-methylase UbiE
VARKGHRLYAACYDVCGRLMDRQVRPMRAFAAGGATGRVLELGCGTGANFAYYDWTKAESVDAIEPDPFMLARARAKAEALPAGKLTLHEATAEALPFPDGSFDTVVATLVLCTVQDPFTAITEVRRVLKPGGSFRLVEHVRGQGRWAGFQDFVQPVYGWLAAGCVLGRPTELTLAAAGFDLDVEQRPAFGPGMPGVVGVARLAAT